MNDAIHHLCDAEAVPKVVERIVPVVLLHAQLKQTHEHRSESAVNLNRTPAAHTHLHAHTHARTHAHTATHAHKHTHGGTGVSE